MFRTLTRCLAALAAGACYVSSVCAQAPAPAAPKPTAAPDPGLPIFEIALALLATAGILFVLCAPSPRET